MLLERMRLPQRLRLTGAIAFIGVGAIAFGQASSAQAVTIQFKGSLIDLTDGENLTGLQPNNLQNATFTGSYTFDRSPSLFQGTTGDGLGSARYAQQVMTQEEGLRIQLGKLDLRGPTGGYSSISREFVNGPPQFDEYRIQSFASNGKTSFGGSISLLDSSSQALKGISPGSDPTSLDAWQRTFVQVARRNTDGRGDVAFRGTLSEWKVIETPQVPPNKVPGPSPILGIAWMGLIKGVQKLRDRVSA
ncbi:MAG: hypothetical protein HC860_02525 [Alkalinema sp. RU_4_3]|nr:hypothetical protein [Alkalinema sp. RU_4_3]